MSAYDKYISNLMDNDPATMPDLSEEEMEQDFEREIEYDPNE